jgi:glucokinase
MRILAGDIGGTHARLASVEPDGYRLRIVRQQSYRSVDYPGLGAIVKRFFAEEESATEFETACFGIACPIVDGICDTPNLPWVIRVPELAEEIGIERAAIINDFAAVGHAVDRLGEDDLVTLQRGEPRLHRPIAVIGAGTGLGQAFLLWNGTYYEVHPSEGGHSTFAPQVAREWGLATFLGRTYGHVSNERVLSGRGLTDIYRHLVEDRGDDEQKSVSMEVERDGAAAVSRNGLAGTDALSVEALEIFASVFGAQAGNLALTVLSSGGVYLAGGIATRIVDKLRDGGFIAAFRAKGRLSSVLETMPVHVIVNPYTGLIGAAAVATRL